jgi:hypothetical protein
MNKKILFLFFILFLGLIGCGQSAKEKRDSAILSARISLTQGNCQQAIDTLESAGRDQFSADYLTTLSSAYSCRAGFSQVVFFGNDVSKIDGSNIQGSFSTFSTSPLTTGFTPDTDLKFKDLQTAIDVLLYAGNLSSPSHSGRSNYFSSRELGNISTQALYLLVSQLGKFGKYYGNSNSNGLKGLGTGTNKCYFEYTDAQAIAALSWLNTNSTNDTCSPTFAGHPDLDVVIQTQADITKRMCRGVILFNNLVDVFIGTTLSTASQFDSIRNIQDDIQAYIVSCNVSGSSTPLGALCNVRSQTECENLATIPLLQRYYAAVYEALHL